MDSQDCDQFKCSYIKTQSFGPLNLLKTHNSNDSTFLWNSFIILVYTDFEFKKPHLTVTAEFIIADVLATSNVIICVDTNGMVHTLPLKMKSNVGSKQYSISFKPRQNGLLKFLSYNETYAVSIFKEHENVFLSINKLSADYKIVNKWSLTDHIPLSPREIKADMCLLAVCIVDEHNKDVIAKIFKIEPIKSDSNSILIIYSLNRKVVYGSILNQKTVNLSHIFLYSSPLNISSIEINDSKSVNVIIILKFGSVVSLRYNLNSDKMENELLPLNASIHNFLIVRKDKFIYTDGNTLWYTEKTATKHETKQNQMHHRQINITQPQNFVLNSTNILCVTYSNIVYSFNLEMSNIFKNDSSDKFISLPRDMTEAKDIIKEISSEMKQNEEILDRIKEESNKSTLVALCCKPELMKNHLLSSVKLFGTFKSTQSELTDTTLMQPIHKYFEDNIFVILIEFEITSEFKHKFNEINRALRKEICFHLNATIEDQNKFSIYSTNLPLNYSVTHPIKMLLALNNRTHKLPLRVNLRIVSPLSGALNKNDKFWRVLHSNYIDISVGHSLMIKYKNNFKETLNDRIFDLAKANCETIFKISKTKKMEESKSFTSYLILPEDYPKLLSSSMTYKKYLSEANAEYFAKKFESLNGLKSKTIYVSSFDKEFCLRVVHDSEDCVKLQITSENADDVFDMRNFLANILYGSGETSSELTLVPQVLYSRLENLRRKLKNAIDDETMDRTSLKQIAENFHENIIGCLPL